MINTVPKGVTLSEPIVPNVVKPVNITLSLTSDGSLRFSGAIRVCRIGPGVRGPLTMLYSFCLPPICLQPLLCM